MAVDSNELLCLKPGKVARDQLADRANLRHQFLMARIEHESKPLLTLRLDIAFWLVLKNDNRAIFTAAAHAQCAVDYLHRLQPEHIKAGA